MPVCRAKLDLPVVEEPSGLQWGSTKRIEYFQGEINKVKSKRFRGALEDKLPRLLFHPFPQSEIIRILKDPPETLAIPGTDYVRES